jgi:hypothetical protein
VTLSSCGDGLIGGVSVVRVYAHLGWMLPAQRKGMWVVGGGATPLSVERCIYVSVGIVVVVYEGAGGV